MKRNDLNYEIRTIDHFRNFWPIFLYLALSIGYPYFMIRRYGAEDQSLFVVMSLVFFLVFLIPQAAIHLNYYFKNKGDSFRYDAASKRYTYVHNGESVTFSLSEIAKAYTIKSYQLANKKMQWFPWDQYNYTRIELKDNRKIWISSLLVSELDMILNSKKTEVSSSFYPWIS